MTKLYFFLSLFLFCCIRLSAQDTLAMVDRVYTFDKGEKIGQIVQDRKGAYIIMDIDAKGRDTIYYSHITSVEYRITKPAPMVAKPIDRAIIPKDTSPAKPAPQMSILRDTVTAKPTATMPEATGTFAIPELKRLRNIGIGLALGGVAMVGLGAALMATTQRIPHESAIASATPGNAAGAILAAAGVGLIIPGALIWSKYSRKYNSAKKIN